MRISNTDRVLLSHGGGGRRTEELIRSIFAGYLSNPILDRMDDAAKLQLESGKGELVFTTDSFVVKPIFFPGGDIGRLAVSGTVNDIAVMGAEPIALSAAFILEEGLSFGELEAVVKSMAETLKEAGVHIVTADTKVVERGRAEKLYITTSGIGRIAISPPPSIDRVEPGDLIIVNGPIGLHGIAVMLQREGMEFESEVVSDVAPLWDLIKSVLSPAIKFMRDPTRGGLAMVLNEMAGMGGIGVVLHESALPVTPEVRTVSELLGIDPIEIANEGKVVMVVQKDAADDILSALRRHPLGRDASIIGEITDEHPGKVVAVTEVGTTRIISKPIGETLPRIC